MESDFYVFLKNDIRDVCFAFPPLPGPFFPWGDFFFGEPFCLPWKQGTKNNDTKL